MKQEKTKKLLWKGVSLLALTIAAVAGKVLAVVYIGTWLGIPLVEGIKIALLFFFSTILFDITKVSSLFISNELNELMKDTNKLQGEPVGANS